MMQIEIKSVYIHFPFFLKMDENYIDSNLFGKYKTDTVILKRFTREYITTVRYNPIYGLYTIEQEFFNKSQINYNEYRENRILKSSWDKEVKRLLNI